MRALTILCFVCCFSCEAAQHTATTTSLTDVTTAYNACSDGDELIIPSGSSTWSGTLDVHKNIWIHGDTNWTGLTTANYAGLGTKITRSGQAIFSDARSSNGVFRLSHIAFNGNGQFLNNGQYPIQINSSTSTTNTPQWFRIDHCFLTNGQYFVTMNGINCWGVFDHNVGVNNDNTFQLNGGSYVWHYPLSTFPATTNAAYVEQNLFIQSKNSSQGDMNETIMSGHGIVIVVRSNVFNGVAYTADTQFLPYEHHGAGGAFSTSPPDDTELRGPPYWEIYSNYVTLNHSQRVWHVRGGGKGFTIHDNAVVDLVHDSNRVEATQDDTVGPGTYAGYDQINNGNIWGNTYNGSSDTTVSFSDGNDSTFIQQDRNYFLHSPDATSGNITWSTYDGSHTANFNSGSANTMYPYSMLIYPHPLITSQDGSGGGGGTTGGTGATYSSVISGNITINGSIIIK